MLKASKRKFGEILVAEGLVDKDEVDAALAEQMDFGGPLGEYFLQRGRISESEIARILCIQYGLPFIRTSAYEVRADLLKLIPAETLYRYRILPLDKIGTVYIVATASVPPEEVQELVAKKLGGDVFYYFTLLSDVEAQLRERFSFTQEELLAIDSRRPQVDSAVPEATTDALFGGLDATSWESIFDAAEKNLNDS